jgi:hypothetical protein
MAQKARLIGLFLCLAVWGSMLAVLVGGSISHEIERGLDGQFSHWVN